jgi:hypothetical protein
MPVKKTRHCWRKDLSNFRGLTDSERMVFLLVLEWFESFRARYGLESEADAVEPFWRKEVMPKNRPRETWQLEQWKNAIQWYLNWLDACSEEGLERRRLTEWGRAAARSAGARCGLSLQTTRCYQVWAGRYAKFAGSERKASQLATANRYLAVVANDDHCAYPTKKQALNALTFFLKHACGVENPVFDVKLK